MKNNLKPAIRELNNQIQQQDLPAAKNAYVVLTKKCNGCHLDNDIDRSTSKIVSPGGINY